MAGTQKQYEMMFKLSASLGSNFQSVFKSAINTQKSLHDSIKKVKSVQSNINSYTKSTKALEEQRQKMGTLAEENKNICASIKKHEDNAEKLRKKIKETGDASGELTAQLVEEQRELKKDTKELGKNETQMKQTGDKIDRQVEKLKELSAELKKAGVNTDSLEQKNDELKKSYKRLHKSQQQMGEITKRQQEIGKGISETKGKLMGTVGTVAAVAAAFSAGPIRIYKDFEEQMSTVAGITGATGNELEELKNAAKQAGQNTWATATESAQALEYMSLAGWSSKQSIGSLNDMLKIAKISGMDLGASTDLVTDSMSAMGINVDNLGHYLDVVVKAQNVANIKSGELMEAILGCAGAAKTNGIGLESLSTGLSVFANNGLKGAKAGTAMNAILVRMTSNDKALSEMSKLGVDAFDKQTGSFRDMGDILKELQTKMATMTDAQRDASLKAIAGTNYYSKFAYLLDSVSESAEGTAGSWDVLTQKLNSADGATDKMYKTMMNNLSGALTEAKSAIEAVQLALGETLTPALTKTVKVITPYIQNTATFISNNQDLTKTIIKVTAGLAGLKVGGLAAKLGFLQIQGGVFAVKKAFTSLAILKESKKLGTLAVKFGGILKILAPIVGVAAAIGGAIYYVSQNLESVRKKIQKTFGDNGLAVFDRFWKALTDAGGIMKTAFAGIGTEVFETLREVLPPVVETLGSAADTAMPILADAMREIVPLLANLAKALLPSMAQVAGAVISVIAQLAAAVLPLLANCLKELIPVVAKIITNVLPIFIKLLNGILPILTQIISSVLPVIVNLLEAILPAAMQIIESVLPILTQLLTALLPVFQTITDSVLPAVKQALDSLMPVIHGLIDTALPVLTQLIKALMPVVQMMANVFSAVLGSALRSVSAIVQNVMTVFNGLIAFITGVFTGNWSQAWEGIKSIFSGAVGGLGEIIKAPLRQAVSAVNTVIEGLNKIKVPDWVPKMGGKSINIPKIPGFAKGTMHTPDTFIAGEAGPELVTNAPGRTVYTASETAGILAAQKAAAAAKRAPAETNKPLDIRSAGGAAGNTKNVVINQTNNITINGEKPEQLEEVLEENNRKLVREVDAKFGSEEEDERRTRFE